MKRHLPPLLVLGLAVVAAGLWLLPWGSSNDATPSPEAPAHTAASPSQTPTDAHKAAVPAAVTRSTATPPPELVATTVTPSDSRSPAHAPPPSTP